MKGGEGKNEDSSYAINRYEIPTMNLSIICHRHELGILTTAKTGKEDMEMTRRKRVGRGKGLKKETSCVIYMYVLPKLNANFMYYKRRMKLKLKKISKIANIGKNKQG